MGGECIKEIGTFADLVQFIGCTVNNSVIPLLFSVALVVFIGTAVQYLLSGKDETKRSQARQYLMWGVIALFVMVAVWGILLVINAAIGLNNFGIPQFRTTG